MRAKAPSSHSRGHPMEEGDSRRPSRSTAMSLGREASPTSGVTRSRRTFGILVPMLGWHRVEPFSAVAVIKQVLLGLGIVVVVFIGYAALQRAPLIFPIWAGVMVLLGLRSLIHGTFLAPGRIRVRTVPRTRTVGWDEVASVEVRPKKWFGLAAHQIVLVLNSGMELDTTVIGLDRGSNALLRLGSRRPGTALSDVEFAEAVTAVRAAAGMPQPAATPPSVRYDRD
ncbi:hypothetical protein D5S17_32120 [Pseudonocardiaceae bacterium YIM PH 21723]|nr:hypothetical protein D5S17_32120 [Pseudonocardiaceae bacterium YIM PH 21723]